MTCVGMVAPSGVAGLSELQVALRAEQEAQHRFDWLLAGLLRHGQPFLHVEQGSSDWQAARTGRVTASDFTAVCGLSSFCTPRSLWQYRTGRVAGDWAGNEHTARGNATEATARDEYSRLTGNRVQLCGLFLHREHQWLAASPDGLVGEDGLLEIKCPVHLHDAIPPHYLPQVQGQLAVTGRAWAHFYSFVQGGGSALYAVARSEEYWAWMLPRLQTFYACVQSDEDPGGDLPCPPVTPPPPVVVQCLGQWVTAGTL